VCNKSRGADKTRADKSEEGKSPHAPFILLKHVETCIFILLKHATLWPPRTMERSDKDKTTEAPDKQQENKKEAPDRQQENKKEAEARPDKERGVDNR